MSTSVAGSTPERKVSNRVVRSTEKQHLSIYTEPDINIVKDLEILLCHRSNSLRFYWNECKGKTFESERCINNSMLE